MVEILEKLSKEIIMDNKKIDTEKRTLQALHGIQSKLQKLLSTQNRILSELEEIEAFLNYDEKW